MTRNHYACLKFTPLICFLKLVTLVDSPFSLSNKYFSLSSFENLDTKNIDFIIKINKTNRHLFSEIASKTKELEMQKKKNCDKQTTKKPRTKNTKYFQLSNENKQSKLERDTDNAAAQLSQNPKTLRKRILISKNPNFMKS